MREMVSREGNCKTLIVTNYALNVSYMFLSMPRRYTSASGTKNKLARQAEQSFCVRDVEIIYYHVISANIRRNIYKVSRERSEYITNAWYVLHICPGYSRRSHPQVGARLEINSCRSLRGPCSH